MRKQNPFKSKIFLVTGIGSRILNSKQVILEGINWVYGWVINEIIFNSIQKIEMQYGLVGFQKKNKNINKTVFKFSLYNKIILFQSKWSIEFYWQKYQHTVSN